MERRTVKRLTALAVVTAFLSSSTVLWAKEEFQARLFPGLGPGSQKAKKLQISVENYTTAEEVFELIEIFNKRGYEQFRGAFRGMKKGFLRPSGGRGVKIILHAAQNIQTGKGRKILLVGESQSWNLDASLRYDSRFPFLVVELNIDNKGKGEGKVYVQADIQLTGQGAIDLASYDSPPKQLFGVRLLK